MSIFRNAYSDDMVVVEYWIQCIQVCYDEAVMDTQLRYGEGEISSPRGCSAGNFCSMYYGKQRGRQIADGLAGQSANSTKTRALYTQQNRISISRTKHDQSVRVMSEDQQSSHECHRRTATDWHSACCLATITASRSYKETSTAGQSQRQAHT